MKKPGLLSMILVPAILISVNLKGISSEPVVKEVLGDFNGSQVCLFTLKNKDGNILKLTNYGARIVRIEVPDRNGK